MKIDWKKLINNRLKPCHDPPLQIEVNCLTALRVLDRYCSSAGSGSVANHIQMWVIALQIRSNAIQVCCDRLTPSVTTDGAGLLDWYFRGFILKSFIVEWSK
jgi:hypothetical protein